MPFFSIYLVKLRVQWFFFNILPSLFKSIILGVQFDIDVQSRDISVSENNGTVTVCVRRSGDTTQVYSVTLKAKENTIGLIADGKMYYMSHNYLYILLWEERGRGKIP